jgi:hypothetical protein
MRSLVLSLFFYFFVCASSQAGLHTGNGGGLSELNLVHAWSTMNSFLAQNIKDGEPIYTRNEMSALHKLASNQSQELPVLFFSSEKQNPGFFIDPKTKEVLLYKTEPMIGSGIYLNQDVLFIQEGEFKRSMTLQESYRILLTILISHNQLSLNQEVLWQKMMFIMNDSGLIMVNLKQSNRPDISLGFLNFNGVELYLTTENIRLDITRIFFNKLVCLEGAPDENFTVTQVNHKYIGILNPDDNTSDIIFSGEVNYNCQSYQYHGKFEIKGRYKISGSEDIPLIWYYNDKLQASIESKDVSVNFFNIYYE